MVFGRSVAAVCAAVCAMAATAACTPGLTDRATLTPVAFRDLPGWRSEHVADALPALLRSCARLSRMPPDQALGGEGEALRLGGTPGQWSDTCAAATRVRHGNERAARAFLEASLAAYAVGDNYDRTGLFTGYYEPELLGSPVHADGYGVRLLARPADLIEVTVRGPDGAPLRSVGRRVGRAFKPYFDRAAIEAGALDGQGLELAWLADPADLWFLQVQGSGRVLLPDGQVMRVGYAGQNGRKLIDVGREIARRGGLPRWTMQAIRDWLSEHPDDRQAVIETDPSYVFFHRVEGLGPEDGPIGAFGVPLTPGRSVAVDPRFVPLGSPVWIDTRDVADAAPLQRLAVAQDVGGAIRGPARADVFYGWGAEAGRHAGGMWAHGGAYLLLPRAPEPVLVAEAGPAAK